MSRPSLAVAVVVLLAVLSVTAVGGAVIETPETSAPVLQTTPGEPNHLAINANEVAASNTTTVDLDVGTSIAADSSSLRANFTESWYLTAIENAESEVNRTRIRQRTLTRIENESETLRQRNLASIEAYASGDLSTAEFFGERARITARADELHRTVLTIRDELPIQPSREVRQLLNYQRGQLRVLQGQISAEAATQSIRGGDDSTFFLETSDSGYTLARITGGAYHRETFLGDEWQPDSPDRFATEPSSRHAVRNRTTTLYPWVAENNLGGGGVFGLGIYWTSWELPSGTITVYLDGGTTNVIHEYQERALASFNTTEVINRTSEDVRITVERTYETGPAAVTLRDADAGTPIDGTVAIGDREPVSVDGDGTYLFVAPRGDVTINATADGTDLSVTLPDTAPIPTPQPPATPEREG